MTSYILIPPVFKQTNFIIFYYYNFKGDGRGTIKGRLRFFCAAGCNSVCRIHNVNFKFHPCWIRPIGFIDAEDRIIVIIIGNSKLQHGLVVIVYFSITSVKTSSGELVLPEHVCQYHFFWSWKDQKMVCFKTSFEKLERGPPKILIRRFTIVVLSNAPELQNSITLIHNTGRNYSTKPQLPRLGSVENLNLNPNWVTGFVVPPSPRQGGGEGRGTCGALKHQKMKCL